MHVPQVLQAQDQVRLSAMHEVGGSDARALRVCGGCSTPALCCGSSCYGSLCMATRVGACCVRSQEASWSEGARRRFFCEKARLPGFDFGGSTVSAQHRHVHEQPWSKASMAARGRGVRHYPCEPKVTHFVLMQFLD